MLPFTIAQRFPHYVDVLITPDATVDTYRLEVADNFDATYSTLLECTNIGHIDASLTGIPSARMNGDRIRVIFDPDNYPALLQDNKPFWLRLVPITAGAPGTPSLGVLVEQAGQNRYRNLVLAGTAPNYPTVQQAMQIGLPGSVRNMSVRNVGSASLLIAFEENGTEFEIPVGENQAFPLFGSEPLLLVRGKGSTVDFVATFIRADAR